MIAFNPLKKVSKYAFWLLILLLLSGCSFGHNNDNEDIFEYRNSYVGDNSAVYNMIQQLPNADYFGGLELKTNQEPYGMILEYEQMEALKETVITNATYIFALVDNADWITMNVTGQSYTLTREELQEWYGIDLGDFTNEEDLNHLIFENLENESKMNQLTLF